MLLRNDSEWLDHFLPGIEPPARKITIDPPDVRFPELGDFLEDCMGMARAGVIGIDEHGQAQFAPLRPRHCIVQIDLLLLVSHSA